jgi:phage gp29-like protein
MSNSNGASRVGQFSIVDQFGRFPAPRQDDPAFQRPRDPLQDMGRTIDRARRIDREIPNVVVESGWTPERIRTAFVSLVVGLFDLPAQLDDTLAVDSRAQSAMRTRTNGLLGQLISFSPPPQFAKDDKAKKCCRRWENHWPQMEAEPALALLLENADSLGFGYAQLLWDTGAKEWYPYLQNWNARYAFYHWILRAHIIVSLDGLAPVTPGDAHWILHAPYGQYRGWMRGSIRAVAQWWLARSYALRDWARYSERHGFPMVLADTPFGADPVDIQNFWTNVQGLGQESVIQLPNSVDLQKYGKYDLRYLEPKDRNWQAFKELIEQCNTEITLAKLGQNLTSEVKEGSLAAARMHGDVLQVWLEADARSLSRTLYTQILRPFAALNYGNADLAPIPKWNVKPPEDQEMKARTFASFADGVNKLRQGGINIENIEKFAARFGLKGMKTVDVDPTQVAAKLVGATGEEDPNAQSGEAGGSGSGAKPAKPVGIKPVKPSRPVGDGVKKPRDVKPIRP